MFYCEGSVCQMKHKCIFHRTEKHPQISKYRTLEYIDQSVNGSASYSDNGFCETWNCGDHGGYVLFEPIPQDIHEKRLEDKLDKWGINLYNCEGDEKSIYEILCDIIDKLDDTLTKN